MGTFLIVIVVMIVITVVLSSINSAINKDKQPQERAYERMYSGSASKVNKTNGSGSKVSETNMYEDPLEGMDARSGVPNKDKGDRSEIFNVSDPFYYALQQDDFLSGLDGDLIPTAKLLAEIDDSDVQEAISRLLDQDSYRSKSGLPQYLQLLPINNFIRKGIFIEPDESQMEELLLSWKMKELRSLCDDIDVQAARSKAETVERILASEKELSIEYDSYFKANPKIQQIHDAFDEFCRDKIIRQLNENQSNIKEVRKKVYEDQLGEAFARDGYKLQEYGYESLIFFRQANPLLRLFGYTIRNSTKQAVLLQQGKILLYNAIMLGRTRVAGIVVMNKEKNALLETAVINPSWSTLNYIPNQNVVFCNTKDDKTWILDAKSMEHKIVSNPDGKSIYALLEEVNLC